MAFLPQIPIIQKSKEAIEEEAAERMQPPASPNIDLSDRGDKQAQFNYYAESQDYTSEIQFIKAMLEGKSQFLVDGNLVWDYPRDEKGKAIKKPFCTPEGQSWIIDFTAPFLQKGTNLSNYSIDTVLDRCDTAAEVLNEAIYINARDWHIDPARYPALVEVIMDRIEAARRRAVNNEERGFVGKAITALINLTGNATPKTGGLLGMPERSRI